jgi:ABC-type hemin transport system substrate-binding protein
MPHQLVGLDKTGSNPSAPSFVGAGYQPALSS